MTLWPIVTCSLSSSNVNWSIQHELHFFSDHVYTCGIHLKIPWNVYFYLLSSSFSLPYNTLQWWLWAISILNCSYNFDCSGSKEGVLKRCWYCLRVCRWCNVWSVLECAGRLWTTGCDWNDFSGRWLVSWIWYSMFTSSMVYLIALFLLLSMVFWILKFIS